MQSIVNDRTRAAAQRRKHVHLLRFAVAGLLAAGWFTFAAAPAHAVDIVKVEEDWVVEVGVPDPAGHAPQIISVISPSPTLDWSHAVFELNHATLPAYNSGGLQLQHWRGENVYDFRNAPQSSVLSFSDETVKYTTRMSLSGGNLQFEIVNGTSQTWGSFGGQGYLKTSRSTGRSDLNEYSPVTSVKYSRVGFASHRVKKFVLKQVRYYSASGLVLTDSTERVVHEHTGE